LLKASEKQARVHEKQAIDMEAEPKTDAKRFTVFADQKL
jgi:hypothetical protein